MKISERSIVDIGSCCNINCKHCYFYGKKRRWKNIFWVMANILLIRICRMKDIDITGGEPSIHPQIDFIVAWCDLLGFREIRLVTNGKRYFKLEKIMDENRKVRFSVSVHSQNEGDLTRLTGAADLAECLVEFFERCREKINYVNCVITDRNLRVSNILDITKLIYPGTTVCFKHLDYNFQHGVRDFTMSQYRIALNKAIREAPEGQRIDLRFFPFCFLDKDNKARENVKCCSAITNTYDRNDWLPVISRKTPWYRWILFIFGTSKIREREALAQARIQGKSECAHAPQCTGCKWEDTCDGVQKGYLKNFGNKELVKQ